MAAASGTVVIDVDTNIEEYDYDTAAGLVGTRVLLAIEDHGLTLLSLRRSAAPADVDLATVSVAIVGTRDIDAVRGILAAAFADDRQIRSWRVEAVADIEHA